MPVAPKVVIASPSDDESAHARVGLRDGADRIADGSVANAAAGIAMRDPAEFQRCLAVPALVRNGAFALHVCLAPDDAVVPRCAWRLGLVIPKRYEASAVARNTIKRRWRAAFRQGREAWAGEFGSADLVVRMQGPLMKKADVAAAGPAKVRARERFEPQAMLELLTTRLRGRPARGRRNVSSPATTAAVATALAVAGT